MAKDSREPQRSKARILFGFAEIEGGDSALTENVRSLAAAVVRALQGPAPQPRPPKALPPAGGPKSKDETPTLFDETDSEAVEEGLDSIDGEIIDPEDAKPAAAPPKTPRSPKKPISYSFVTNLNLRPADGKSLRDFYATKSPRDTQEQVAVFVYYLEKIAKVTAIGSNHLYTCFKDVEKRVPPDIGQIARNAASRKGWIDSSDANNLRMVSHGENFVEHDLPRKNASKTEPSV